MPLFYTKWLSYNESILYKEAKGKGYIKGI
nr:MAG TPA: hypothetical protein [Caudoviricetes sp.]